MAGNRLSTIEKIKRLKSFVTNVKTFFMKTETGTNKLVRKIKTGNKVEQKKETLYDKGESKEIPISQIDFSPLNYRKFFSQPDLENFASELALHGIISPLTVRPMSSGRFELVAGERRLRAAKIARFKVVPVTIRQLTDEQVIEIQLSENLQRENPHPLHEAEAIGQMQRHCMTIDEIASRLGKSKQFVYTRLKLLSLVHCFKEMVFENAISLNDALQIATLSGSSQTEFFDEHCSNWKEQKRFNIGYLEHYLNRYRYDLKNAPFNPKDKNLLPEAGACTTCPSNSASLKSLFPDYAKNAVCSNKECYNNKCGIHFLAVLKEAITTYQPESILFRNQLTEMEEKIIGLVPEAAELPRYNCFDVTIITKPVKPDKDDHTYQDEKGKSKLDKEEYNEAIENYTSDLEAYELNIKSGHFKVALVLTNTGFEPVYFSPEKPKQTHGTGQVITAKEVQEAIKSGSATPELLDAEIARIKQREERSQELDKQKVQLAIHNLLSQHTEEVKNERTLTSADMIGARLLIYQSLDYSAREKVRSVLFPKSKRYESENCQEIFAVMSTLKEPQFSYLIRMAICSKSESKYPMQHAGYFLYQIAKEAGLPVSEIENEQVTKAKERLEKQQNKIKDLKSKIKKMKQAA
jgi:ParB family chromosome partitioning protein